MTCLTLRVWMMILTTEHDGAFVKRPCRLANHTALLRVRHVRWANTIVCVYRRHPFK